MATLQVRDIDDRLYNFLKTSAKLQNRSISQEVLTIIENYLNSPKSSKPNATLEFLSLTGAWNDERTADEIIEDLRNSRKQSSRFGEKNGIFA
ncbi:MAG: FitA-like ribbon-helix-helix domain-containing protein [Spirochaetota bacterium]|jgi:plasmid stability protein